MEKPVITTSSKIACRDNVIMLTAWVQTESSWLQQSDRERELQHRIDELEMQLTKVNELAQHIIINSDVGRQQFHQYSQQQTHSHYNYLISPNNNSSTIIHSNNNTGNDNNNDNHNIDSNRMSVINPLKRSNLLHNESIKYKIVPQGTDGVNIEPIDVRLETSSDDNITDQLNSSDNESGRLVICVPTNNDEDQQEIKSDIERIQNYSVNGAAKNYSNSDGLLERKNSPDSSTNYHLSEDQTSTLTEIFHHNDARLTHTNNNSNAASIAKSTIKNNESGCMLYQDEGHASLQPLVGIRVAIPPLQTHNMQSNEKNHLQQSIESNNMSSVTLTPVKSSPSFQRQKQHEHEMDGPINYSCSSNTTNMIPIGKYGTKISQEDYDKINWDSPAHAIRKLLMSTFGRQTLATHSLTGRPSPAFKGQNKPIKQKLDKLIIEDIIDIVMRNSSMPRKEIRSIITTKCADENKMMKLRLNKRTPMRELNTDESNNSGN